MSLGSFNANTMTSTDGDLIDVFKGLIDAATSWGNTTLIIFGLAGVALAGAGGKRIYDAAQYDARHGAEGSPVLQGIAMVVAGSLLTIAAIIAGAASFLFTT